MISKSATDRQKSTQNLIFTKDARTAWAHLLYQVKRNRQTKALLPGYIGFTEREGSGVFDPIEEVKADFAFYRVRDHLEVDMNHFEDILSSGTITVALVIHYFGFCRNDLKRIKQLCEQYQVLLVEDCAHAFHLGLKRQVLGVTGDFSFYSLHKYFATDSGGILKINTDKVQFELLDPAKKASVEVLEQYIKTDFEEVARIRRQNYSTYEEQLSQQEGVELFYHLEKDDIPQSFPIRVRGLRERLYFYLMEKGIPTIALYYRMIDQIRKEEFPVSFEIAQDILNLPVHQDTTHEDVTVICNAIAEFFKRTD